MKTLSVRQPWASYIAYGVKTVEHRSWSTTHRGELLIHSSGYRHIEEFDDGEPDILLPYGVILCRITLVDCRPFLAADVEAAMMPEAAPGYAWVLTDPQPVEPIRAKGKLHLWEFSGDITPLPSGRCHVEHWHRARSGAVIPS